MVLKVARRGRIDPFIVMEVMRAAAERAATGADVVHLEVGQPSTRAPRKVLEAAKAALERDLIGYTLALGIPELRARIARHYQEFYGADVPAERVVVTTGSVLSYLNSAEAAGAEVLPALSEHVPETVSPVPSGPAAACRNSCPFIQDPGAFSISPLIGNPAATIT